MMLDIATAVNATPKAQKKPVPEMDGEVVAEFLTLLGGQVAEGETFQGLEGGPFRKLTQDVDGENGEALLVGQEADGEVFQCMEDAPFREPAKDATGEDVMADVLVPVGDYPVFQRVAVRPLPEDLRAAESEPTVPIAVLDGKAAVPLADVPRVAVPIEAPLLPANSVNETTVRLEELADRFDQRMLSMVQRSEKVTRITLSPATLGRLTVVCSQENSTMSVEIVAQTGGVRDLIAGQEEAVRRLMEAHAVELGSFDVMLDQGQGGSRHFEKGSWLEQQVSGGTDPALIEDGDPQPLSAVRKSGAVSLMA